jgi:hypothetical protein
MRGVDDNFRTTKVLFKEGDWMLLDTQHGRAYNTGPRGWQSVIKHWCILNGSPYWMLLERHDTPTRCVYCKVDMPDSIVCLFKLQNEEAMQ